MRGSKGFALVLTLIVTALMVAILVEMIHQIYVDLSLSRRYSDGQQASLLAESGVTGARKLLQLALQGKNYTSLSDAWASPVKLDDETGSIEVTITEESGKLNLNDVLFNNDGSETSTLRSLKRLGKRFQIPEDIWSALADWMDSDDLPRSNGAENSYYHSLKQPYSAHNGKLMTTSELSLIKGFTPEYVAAVQPFVTVFAGPQSLVNINTASKEVLTALDPGIDDRMADRILEERRLKPFSALGELSRISGGETLASKLAGKANCQGTLFRVTSVGRVKETARTVETVLRMSGGTAEILSWQEY